MKTSSAVRAVIYDLDGTLIDSRADLADSVNAMLTGSGTGTVTAVTPPGFANSNFLTVTVFF
jgi:phosphoglycolate phosphatase-like HAD superfamily hydrolase